MWRESGRNRTLHRVGVLMLVMLGGAALSGLVGWRVNVTPSLPRGLYRVSHSNARRGSLVLVCLPVAWARYARARHYVPRGDACPGGVVPVGKHVLAAGGDTVRVTAAGVKWNGVLVPHTRPHAADHRGRPLPTLVGHTFVLRPTEVWLSTASDVGFDSRYVGPVPRTAIIATVRPLWPLGEGS
jgi:conjugative transfer signal peptidase TraF